MFDQLRPLGLQLRTDLENLDRLREHIQQLTATYVEKQASLLRKVQERGDLQTVAVVSDYLRRGVQLRWGNNGWEITDTGVRVPTRIGEHLYGVGFTRPESEQNRRDYGHHPGEIIGNLLSDDSITKFRDDSSKRAFRADQSRAYFEYLNGLLGLYQEHSVLRGAENYPDVLQEKIRFSYYFAWLYFAGFLHKIGISEGFRIRMAQGSLGAIASLIR